MQEHASALIAHLTTVAAAKSSGNVGPIAPGLVCFLIVVVLGLALWVLLRSLNRHLGKVDNSADEDAAPMTGPAADSREATSH
jgi:hypothetical protein